VGKGGLALREGQQLSSESPVVPCNLYSAAPAEGDLRRAFPVGAEVEVTVLEIDLSPASLLESELGSSTAKTRHMGVRTPS